MFNLFRKKKIYKVEYKDEWWDYGYTVVIATDKADAWKKARKQYFSVYKPTICISITELKDA